VLTCPKCSIPLRAVKTPTGIGWICRRCGGRAANLSVMRRALQPAFMRQLWLQARESSPAALVVEARRCPSCAHEMRVVVVAGEEAQPVELDLCPHCQMAWMDADEVEALPRLPRQKSLSPEARQKVAMMEVELMRMRAKQESGGSPPENAWQILIAIFGLPVDEDTPSRMRRPWLTLTLAALMIAGFLVQYHTSLTEWAFIPSQPFRHGGLTWFTLFFLHAGIFHLVSNLYFLLVFGDNVEDLLGRGRYLALIAAGIVLADALHLALDPRATVPLVGASGGISAIIAFYALALPRVRLVFSLAGWVGWWTLYTNANDRWFRISARWAFALWVLLQVVGGVMQWFGFSTISAFGHLGGAVAGVGLWLLWRRQLPTFPEHVSN
jgi:membrane associated rhomboid family serine protease